MTENQKIAAIQADKNNTVTAYGLPPLNDETQYVMGKKRMSLDEPPFFRKQDPLR